MIWNGLYNIRNRLLDREIRATTPPAFIVGCGHSGTTIMLALIGRHAQMYPVPFESNILRPMNSRSDIEEFVTHCEQEAGRRRFIEKTPRHLDAMDRLFRLFPEAQAIAMVRDGRDVAISIAKRKGSLKEGTRRWISASKTLVGWTEDPRVLVVRYEDLVARPVLVIGRVLKFLGLDGDARELLETNEEFEWRGGRPDTRAEDLRSNSHLQRRRWQVNASLYDGGVLWRREMTIEQLEEFEQWAGWHLDAWGYTRAASESNN